MPFNNDACTEVIRIPQSFHQKPKYLLLVSKTAIEGLAAQHSKSVQRKNASFRELSKWSL